ncbi:MAG: serine hydrolase [Sulfitobacter sp.]|nr:serine hydrolase [Sulfitobacter sp.]
MTGLTRRRLIVTATAGLALPAYASETPEIGGVAERAEGLDQLHALVIHQGGETLFAEAFRGAGLDEVANIKSVSKTILALLTGIAIQRGVIEGTHQKVLPLLGRDPVGDARDDLTIGHLLSMQAGLASTSGGNYGAWVSSDNWVDYVLSEPSGEPGGRFIYSTGGWHVLGAALSAASGLSLLEMARDWLGDPLGVDFAPWVADPQGRYLGGNDMGVSPRGLARIGDMVLKGGMIDGIRVLPETWIETSWQPRARSPFSGDAYGYGWFLTRLEGTEVAYGRGYGGQMLAIVPAHDLTLAITSDPTLPARSGGYFGDLKDLVRQTIAAV